MPLVYLAGPLAGKEYTEAVQWRSYVAHRLAIRSHGRIQCSSPMRGKPSLKPGDIIDGTHQNNAALNVVPKQIFARDRADVFRCDVVLANFQGAERVSIGTCFELAWANAWNKPIVVVTDAKWHDHLFIEQAAGWHLTSLDDAITAVQAMFETEPV